MSAKLPRTSSVKRASAAFAYQHYPLLPRPGQIKGFYVAVGKAITSWQMVEASLSEIFRAACAPQTPSALVSGFAAIHTTRAKMKVVNAAVQFLCYNEPDLVKRWKTLFNRASRLDEKRNILAHFSVVTAISEPNKEKRIYLSNAYHNPLEAIQRKHQPYTAKVIRDYERKFREVSSALRLFAVRIHRLQKQLQESPVSAPRTSNRIHEGPKGQIPLKRHSQRQASRD